MKNTLFLFAIFFTLVSNGQQNYHLSISPNIDKANPANKIIIGILTEFLKNKDSSLTENKYWLQTDFKKYIYPYSDIYNIENSKYGRGYHQPTLMEIIPTDKPNRKVLKIAFIGHNKEAEENQLKSIYNLIANIEDDKIVFSRYLDYATENWNTIKKGSLTYKISPNKILNKSEVLQQQKEIAALCKFFNCNQIPILYYSCISPKELFEIKGFDYNTMMYVSKTGGYADFGNIIFSGNNAEIYTHEIIHIYTNHLFPKIDKFFDEGLATFIAGSGKYSYNWHRNKFKEFLKENKAYNFTEHTDIYERIYFENETSIPYLTAALILERTFRMYGKGRLLSLLNAESSLSDTLGTVGLTKENINNELQKEINLSSISISNNPFL